MNVDSMFTVRIKALEWAGDFDRSCCILLAEGNDSTNIGVVGVQDADGISCGFGCFRFVHKVWYGRGCTGKGQSEFSEHF